MANLREEYTQHIHNTAPDMDKLWDRISEEIDKKETANITEEEHTKNREQIKRSGGYMKIAAVAAAFIVIFAGVNIMNESKKQKDLMNGIPTSRTEKAATDAAAKNEAKSDETENTKAADDIGAAEGAQAAEDTEEMQTDTLNIETWSAESSVRYEQLLFNETDTVSFVSNYVPAGNEYFVEKDVLSQTDCFADVIVIGADLADEGGADYTLTIISIYDKDGNVSTTSDDGTLTIRLHSSTPYILQENREYLIPLKQGAGKGEYSIVFENAPQIELTLDGGAVFQNGWTALDSGSKTLQKDCLNVNDFYFDRMKYTPVLDLSELLTEWKNA